MDSGIFALWETALKYSSQNIRPCILILLLEILEWFCEFFIVTQNSQLLWITSQMICQFIIAFGETCLMDISRMREYLAFVSAIALKNYRLYEDAKALLNRGGSVISHSDGMKSISYSIKYDKLMYGHSAPSVEWYLLQFALDISSSPISYSLDIPNFTVGIVFARYVSN